MFNFAQYSYTLFVTLALGLVKIEFIVRYLISLNTFFSAGQQLLQHNREILCNYAELCL